MSIFSNRAKIAFLLLGALLIVLNGFQEITKFKIDQLTVIIGVIALIPFTHQLFSKIKAGNIEMEFRELGIFDKIVTFLVGMASEQQLTYYKPRGNEHLLNEATHTLVEELNKDYKSEFIVELRKWICIKDNNLRWMASEIVGYYDIKELAPELKSRYKDKHQNDKWAEWELNYIWAHSKLENDFDELIDFLKNTTDKDNKKWIVEAFEQMVDKNHGDVEKIQRILVEVNNF